jgi:hypothetical protein
VHRCGSVPIGERKSHASLQLHDMYLVVLPVICQACVRDQSQAELTMITLNVLMKCTLAIGPRRIIEHLFGGSGRGGEGVGRTKNNHSTPTQAGRTTQLLGSSLGRLRVTILRFYLL